MGAIPKLLGCGMKADPNPLGLAASPDPRLYVLRKDSILMGPVSGPKSLGSLVRTQMPWVL